MIGKKYSLFGTDTVFEITGEDGDQWVIAVRSSGGEEIGVSMRKLDLNDGVLAGALSARD